MIFEQPQGSWPSSGEAPGQRQKNRVKAQTKNRSVFQNLQDDEKAQR